MKRKMNEAEICAGKLKVLADNVRMSLLQILLKGPKHVWELMDTLRLSQSLVSHHLKILRDEGLVESHRHGKGMQYKASQRVKLEKKRKSISLDCCEVRFPDISE